LGDSNAKIGNNNSGREQTMGEEGLGDIMNKTGELFCDFYAFNGLSIGGSVFPHNNIHKVVPAGSDSTVRTRLITSALATAEEGH
jgi:hypothetical protein